MTIKEMFNKAITDAFKSAYLITEEDKKAVALAQIAAALAQTGAIASSDIEDNSEKSEEKEETKVENKEKADEKKSYKPKKKQGEKLQKQPYDLSDEASEKVSEETPNGASEDSEEVEMAEEWTDETMKKYDPELTYIEDFAERNGNDDPTGLLDSCVGEFSSGVLHSFDDIKPRNVVSFVSWLKDIEASASEENDG